MYRTGDPILTKELFHAMHVILGLKLGDHEDLSLFVHANLLNRTLLVVLPAVLIQIPICAFLSPVPVHCRGQSGSVWCCLAAAGGMPATGAQLQETQDQFCIFCFIAVFLHIISIISIISKTFCTQFVSLPFPPFPFLRWEDGVNRECMSLSLLPPCFKTLHKACKQQLTLSSEVVMSTCGRSAEFSKQVGDLHIFKQYLTP